jgi:dihydroorotase
VAIVRAAKREGLPVTADVSINSLHLTDADIGYFDSAMRLTPPLRQQRDRDALREALADGTIDALVSDHMPVGADEKNVPFAEALPGATGLELLLGLALKWAAADGVPLRRALQVITHGPAQVLGASLGTLQASAGQLVEGGVADVCVYDPETEWAVTSERLHSQGTHTPFEFSISGMRVPGRVTATVVAGTLAFLDSAARPSGSDGAERGANG